MVGWKLVFTKQATKDAKNLARSGLRIKAETLIDVVRINPFQTPPPYEKLVGDLSGLSLGESIFSTGRCIRFWKKSGS